MYRIRWKRVFILILLITAIVLYNKYEVGRIFGKLQNTHDCEYVARNFASNKTALTPNYKLKTII